MHLQDDGVGPMDTDAASNMRDHFMVVFLLLLLLLFITVQNNDLFCLLRGGVLSSKGSLSCTKCG